MASDILTLASFTWQVAKVLTEKVAKGRNTIEKSVIKVCVRESGRVFEAKCVTDFWKMAEEELKPGDRVTVEGVFSPFGPFIQLGSVKEIAEIVHRSFEEGAKRIREKLLDPKSSIEDIICILDLIDSGDIARFFQTAAIREAGFKCNDRYRWYAAVYRENAVDTTGALPLVIEDLRGIYPFGDLCAFKASIEGAVARLPDEFKAEWRGILRVQSPVCLFLHSWRSIEMIEERSLLYLSLWAWLYDPKRKIPFCIASRADLASTQSIQASRALIQEIAKAEQRLRGYPLELIMQADNYKPILKLKRVTQDKLQEIIAEAIGLQQQSHNTAP